MRFTEWREDFNHQHQNVRTENGVEYGDLLKFVDFDYVARVARLNAATMAVLASAPPPPEKVSGGHAQSRQQHDAALGEWRRGSCGDELRNRVAGDGGSDWQRRAAGEARQEGI